MFYYWRVKLNLFKHFMGPNHTTLRFDKIDTCRGKPQSIQLAIIRSFTFETTPQHYSWSSTFPSLALHAPSHCYMYMYSDHDALSMNVRISSMNL